MLEVHGAAGSSKQHELFLSPQTRILNERTSKKLTAMSYCPAKSYEPVRMGPQGEPARQQHQRSQQHGRGAFGAQFLQAAGSYGGGGGAVQERGWGWLGRRLNANANGGLFNGGFDQRGRATTCGSAVVACFEITGCGHPLRKSAS
jgi:hypothetical protein